jgi:hypothetical protein
MVPNTVPSLGARAGHVLGHDGRIARNKFAHVPRQHPGVAVIGAADAVADVELDNFALVEFRRRLRLRRKRNQQQ